MADSSTMSSLTPEGGVGKGAAGVKDAELEFLDHMIGKQSCYGEHIRLVCPIYVIPPSKAGSKKSAKPKRRTLVVGRYRLFLVRKARLGGRVVTKQPHLYELTHIVSRSARALTLVFSWKSDKRSPAKQQLSASADAGAGGPASSSSSEVVAVRDEQHTLDLSSPGVPQIIKFLVEGLQEICQGFPPALQVKIDVCPDNWLAPDPCSDEASIAGGIFATYRAHCSYFRSPISPEFVRFVEEAVALQQRELDLSRCPGLLLGGAADMLVDLVPVCAALRTNGHFTALLCAQQLLDASAKQAVLQMGTVVRYNTALTKLCLRNISCSASHWEFFGRQLAANAEHRLQHLDLSGSRLDGRAFTAVLGALQAYPHALRCLRLADCALSSRSLLALFNLFERRYALSLTLEELDLSDNSWNEDVSAAFERWLEQGREHSRLAVLRLARCGAKINFARIAKPLRHLAATLTTLDLSANVAIDFGAAQLLAVALEGNAVLRRLALAHCKSLKPQSLEGIVRAVLQNNQLQQLHVDLARSGLSFKSVFLLAPLVHACLPRLHTVDLSQNKLDEKGLHTFLLALSKQPAQASTLDTLRIDDCLSKPPKSPGQLVDVLRACFASNPSLRAVSMAGCYGKLLPLFFQQVLTDPAVDLHELNIARNALADAGAVQLAAALRHNSSLLYLNVDGNAIGINGYHAVAAVLEQPSPALPSNQTLCLFQWPWEDYLRLAASLPEEQLARLRQLLEAVHRTLAARLDPARRAWTLVPPTGALPVVAAVDQQQHSDDVAPLAQVPDYLQQIEQQTPFFEIGPDANVELSNSAASSSQPSQSPLADEQYADDDQAAERIE